MKKFQLLLILACLLAVPAERSFAQREGKNRREDKREERGDNANKRFGLAVEKYRNGKADAAEDILKKNLEEFPKHFGSMALLAKIKLEKNELQHARFWVLRALNERPASKPVNLLAAKIFMKMNKPLKAYEFMNRASKSADPDEGNEVKANESDFGDLQKNITASFKAQNSAPTQFYKAKDAGQPNENLLASVPKVDEARRLKVVVFAFEAKSKDSTGFGSSVGEMVTTAMVQTNCYQVVERQQVDKILKEQDFELNDAVDQTTAVKVGELIGVDAIVVGSILKLGAQTELDSRIVNVQSGQILGAANSAYDSEPQIRGAVNTLTVALTKATYK